MLSKPKQHDIHQRLASLQTKTAPMTKGDDPLQGDFRSLIITTAVSSQMFDFYSDRVKLEVGFFFKK